ncbi:MAG: nucleotide exchange factor GrpE [Verrucomicrobiota bacterium]|nr:nucleotide exchange factor GrpE [Verrucomicrobiota bacterium]
MSEDPAAPTDKKADSSPQDQSGQLSQSEEKHSGPAKDKPDETKLATSTSIKIEDTDSTKKPTMEDDFPDFENIDFEIEAPPEAPSAAKKIVPPVKAQKPAPPGSVTPLDQAAKEKLTRDLQAQLSHIPHPTPPAPDLTSKFSEVVRAMTESKEEVRKLNDKFEAKIAQDTHNQSLFSALHKELNSYKDNVLLDIYQKPVIKDLILMYDDLGRLDKQYQEIFCEQINADSTAKAHLKNMGDNIGNMKAQLLEVLNRLDVYPYEEHTTTVDKKLHKPVNVKPTQNPEDDGKIAEIVNEGFRWKERVIRPEEVVVFKIEGNKS